MATPGAICWKRASGPSTPPSRGRGCSTSGRSPSEPTPRSSAPAGSTAPPPAASGGGGRGPGALHAPPHTPPPPPTLVVTARDGTEYPIIRQGRLTALDDPEVRTLAA